MNLGDLLFPPDRRFRPLLRRQADVAVQACELLARTVSTAGASAPPSGATAEMARIESAGDAVRRELTEILSRTYATPFDRDDIFAVSSALDDVADMAQDALLTLSVIGGADYAHVQEMCVSAHEGAWALRGAVEHLPTPAAREPARRAKRSENVIGNLYRYGLDLALRTHPPEQAIRLREVMGELRELSRAIGRAADVVADITVKEK